MKKQLFSVLTFAITLLLVSGNAMAFNGGSEGGTLGGLHGRGGDGGGQIEDDGGGCKCDDVCLDTEYSYITLSQQYDKNNPILPTAVHIDVEYSLLGTPTTILTKEIDFSNFSYDHFDTDQGIATKSVETIIHCNDYNGPEMNYSYYKMTVSATYADGSTSISTIIVIENGKRVNRATISAPSMSSVVAYPNPFIHQLNADYNLASYVENVSIVLRNMSNTVVSTIQSAPKALGANTVTLDTRYLAEGNYILTIYIELAGQVESESLHVIKNASGIGFGSK